jgi:hypothetical protein
VFSHCRDRIEESIFEKYDHDHLLSKCDHDWKVIRGISTTHFVCENDGIEEFEFWTQKDIVDSIVACIAIKVVECTYIR